jgi:hypothetical protein
VLTYLVVFRRNLIGPMITGRKPLVGTVPPARTYQAGLGRALACLVLALLAVWGLVSLGEWP